MDDEQIKKELEEMLQKVETQPELLWSILADIVELEESEGFELDGIWPQDLLISLFRIGAKNKDEKSLNFILDIVNTYGLEDNWDIQFNEVYPEFFQIAKEEFPEMMYEIGFRVENNLDKDDYFDYYSDGSREIKMGFEEIIPYMPSYIDEEPVPDSNPAPTTPPLKLSVDIILDLIQENNGANPEMDKKYLDYLMVEREIILVSQYYRDELSFPRVKRFFIRGLDYLQQLEDKAPYKHLVYLIIDDLNLNPSDWDDKLLRHIRAGLLNQDTPYDLLSQGLPTEGLEAFFKYLKKRCDEGNSQWKFVASKILTEDSYKRLTEAPKFEQIFSPPSKKSATKSSGKSAKKSQPQGGSHKKPYRPKGLKGKFYGLYKLFFGKKK